jgi:hypothetical protein
MAAASPGVKRLASDTVLYLLLSRCSQGHPYLYISFLQLTIFYCFSRQYINVIRQLSLFIKLPGTSGQIIKVRNNPIDTGFLTTYT